MSRTSTDRYATRAFDFCLRVQSCTSSAAIIELTLSELREFGFEYATCTNFPRPGESPLPNILLNNRPVDYLENYAKQNHVAHDPVITHLRQSLRAFSWSEVRESRRLSKKETLIIEEARDFQSTDGLIIPIITGPGGLTVFAPCGRDPELTQRSRAAVEMITCASHQALMRANARAQTDRLGAPDRKLLSPREREVLNWVAAGKTDREIAIILSISPTTVLALVQSAQRKLGTYKRQVAVIEAMRRREINI